MMTQSFDPDKVKKLVTQIIRSSSELWSAEFWQNLPFMAQKERGLEDVVNELYEYLGIEGEP